MANIMIVDDSATMRKIISRSLRQAGLTVDEIYEAADGFEGISVLSSGNQHAQHGWSGVCKTGPGLRMYRSHRHDHHRGG